MLHINIKEKNNGRVVELADTIGLGPIAARCAGSSPVSPTIKYI